MGKNWRFWTGIGIGIVVALLAVTTIGVALAQGPEPGTPPLDRGAGIVDEDGDGICDYCGTGQEWGYPQGGPAGERFADEDGDGVCDNFVDEDGDGVCDNLGAGRDVGRSWGFVDEDGDGVCDDFVDEDGDGVCDNLGAGQRMGRGQAFIDENGDNVCDNFVDEDGDGVCDNLAAGQRMGLGRGAAGGWGQGHRGGGRWQ